MKTHRHAPSILFLVVFLCGVLVQIFAQETYTPEVLEAMTEDELEQICIVRGFQILRDEIDPTTGLPYELSHNDFVEAAQRCLEIEEEMNELLAEYPELAEEVEEEIKKLEAEQIARQAEVRALQEELEEAQNGAGGNDKSNPGAAFVPPEMASDDSDFEIIEDEDEQTITEEATAGTLVEGVDESIAEEVANEEDVVIEDTGVPVASAKKDDAELIAKNETTSKDDFTMRAITFEIIREIVKQVNNDVKRIVELMTPVIRPILRAGDVAWRHLKVAFESARRTYENSQSSTEDEGSSVPAE